ncbi:MAG: hypothetical protein NW208_13590 [Bryobacter sp.]|nr:hypothetical protein [Bryobacter sp.]
MTRLIHPGAGAAEAMLSSQDNSTAHIHTFRCYIEAMMSLHLRSIFVLVCYLLLEVPACAMSCYGPSEACNYFRPGTIIFYGTPLGAEAYEIKNIPRLDYSKSSWLMWVTIDEPLYGLWKLPREQKSTIAIVSTANLPVGRKHLFLVNTLQDGTLLYNNNPCFDWLSFDTLIRSLKQNPLTETSPGTLRVMSSHRYGPINAAKVGLQGKGIKQELLSDSSGRTTFVNLPPGTYLVSGEAGTLRADNKPVNVSLAPGGCPFAQLEYRGDGIISGTIKFPLEADFQSAFVRLIPQGAKHYARQEYVIKKGSEAQFKFVDVPPGHYVIDARPNMVGGEAIVQPTESHTISFLEGTHFVQKLTLALRNRKTYRVTFRDESGEMIQVANILIRKGGVFQHVPFSKVEGGYMVTLRGNMVEEIQAVSQDGNYTGSAKVAPSSTEDSLVVSLKRTLGAKP